MLLFPSARVLFVKEPTSWRTIYRLRVRPPVFTLEKKQGKLIDEKGYEYKAYDIFVVTSKPLSFQPSSLTEIEGLIFPNPRTQSTTLLAYKVTFPEEANAFNLESLERLREKFAGMTVKDRLQWLSSEFAAYSHIIGRDNLATANFLAFFTPLNVKLHQEIRNGWGNNVVIGDTTTAKSETTKKIMQLLKAGTLITAETASAVGLVGTAIPMEKGEWSVDWGFLVLNDRKLLAVDGAHKLPFSQWAALSESERSGVVTIAKAAKNSAYARTRQIKVCNAVDRDSDKFTTKSLSSFLYPIQALTTVFDKTGIARLDLAVFSDHKDVSAEDVNARAVTSRLRI